jgi:hypothetical protein
MRYGVTSGYIRAQRLRTDADYAHFDVIVYDRLDSPILWTESNPDKSASGVSRIIPAEYVRAVIELKAAFSRSTVKDAIAKLGQLGPLMAGVDSADDRYPTYLPEHTVLTAIFFELREAQINDFEAVSALRSTWSFQRVAYPPMVLFGEGRSEDDTALIRATVSDTQTDEIVLERKLLANFYMSSTSPEGAQNVGMMLDWSPLNFSRFAFDLLAIMNGTYEHGRVSSFHGLDLPST